MICVQNACIHVLVFLACHFVVLLSSMPALCGASGKTAGAEGGGAGGSNIDLL